MNTPGTIRFRFTGPAAVGFDSIRAEVHPGEEFAVPEALAVAFANHGHCQCLEPDKLELLLAAEAAKEAANDAARAAAGLAESRPAAQASAPSPPDAPEAAVPARAKAPKVQAAPDAPAADAAAN